MRAADLKSDVTSTSIEHAFAGTKLMAKSYRFGSDINPCCRCLMDNCFTVCRRGILQGVQLYLSVKFFPQHTVFCKTRFHTRPGIDTDGQDPWTFTCIRLLL
jgi:hypothetical protein